MLDNFFKQKVIYFGHFLTCVKRLIRAYLTEKRVECSSGASYLSRNAANGPARAEVVRGEIVHVSISGLNHDGLCCK